MLVGSLDFSVGDCGGAGEWCTAVQLRPGSLERFWDLSLEPAILMYFHQTMEMSETEDSLFIFPNSTALSCPPTDATCVVAPLQYCPKLDGG